MINRITTEFMSKIYSRINYSKVFSSIVFITLSLAAVRAATDFEKYD